MIIQSPEAEKRPFQWIVFSLSTLMKRNEKVQAISKIAPRNKYNHAMGGRFNFLRLPVRAASFLHRAASSATGTSPTGSGLSAIAANNNTRETRGISSPAASRRNV